MTRMAGGPIHFTLDGDERVTIAEENVWPLYDLLWQLAPKPGAVSLAAILHAASLQSEYTRPAYELTVAQGALLREAISLLHDSPS